MRWEGEIISIAPNCIAYVKGADEFYTLEKRREQELRNDTQANNKWFFITEEL